jgi:hypothetical protein
MGLVARAYAIENDRTVLEGTHSSLLGDADLASKFPRGVSKRAARDRRAYRRSDETVKVNGMRDKELQALTAVDYSCTN